MLVYGHIKNFLFETATDVNIADYIVLQKKDYYYNLKDIFMNLCSLFILPYYFWGLHSAVKARPVIRRRLYKAERQPCVERRWKTR